MNHTCNNVVINICPPPPKAQSKNLSSRHDKPFRAMTTLKTIYVERAIAGIMLCLGLIILFLAVKRGDVKAVEGIIEKYIPIFH